MSRPAKTLAVYGAALAAVLAVSFAVGRGFHPVRLSADSGGHAGANRSGGGLPGLARATGDLALVTATDRLVAGVPSSFSFKVTDEDGTVTDFDLEQTKRMHLIVVRRDFVGFLHDHPTMAPDGTWSTTFTLAEPGPYRVFADFIVDGDKHTLGADLFVPGIFEPVPVPPPGMVADAGDGYEVEIRGEVTAGEESELEFVVRRGGEVVRDIPDYLGAKGHLVALRDGDLAYLHVHPDEDRLVFEAEFPTAGAYRLFLQFDHGGEIRTAAFTVEAAEESD